MILNIIEILIFVLSILLSVAYLTVAERKTLAYMQRRVGPNAVGYYGLLMAIADALKLLLKEIIIPRDSNSVILIISPLITLFSALLSWAIIPFGPGITISDNQYGFIYSLAISSIGVFGTLLVGWSSNSKYSLLGSIRSTAQLISYELVLTTIVLICILITSELNLTNYIEYQRVIYLCYPLFPLLIIFFITCVAETGRPPFDNIEAESELVSGHLTELSAAPFVLFFLSEYANIMFMSSLTSILFIGGYLIPYININILSYMNNSIFFFFIEGLIYGGSLGFKANFFMFTYIWVRAAFPRLRYDLLLQFCWTVLLPLIFSIIIFIPSILYSFDIFSHSI